MENNFESLICPTCRNESNRPRVQKFIEVYGEETLDKVVGILLDDNGVAKRNNNYESCTDKQCDDEGCRMYKAFKLYLKYK